MTKASKKVASKKTPAPVPAPAEDFRSLGRRKVRYWCFRCKTEVGTRTEVPGVKADGIPSGLREYFEGHRHFTGWAYFNETAGWDVGIRDPFKIVPLKKGSDDAWNEVVEAEARDFPEAATTPVEG
jgi:hypothetical protein